MAFLPWRRYGRAADEPRLRRNTLSRPRLMRRKGGLPDRQTGFRSLLAENAVDSSKPMPLRRVEVGA